SIGAIDNAIRKLKDKTYLPLATPISWGYTIKGFILRIDVSSSTQYPKIIKNAFINFGIDVKGEHYDYTKEIKDPFKHLEFNLVIEGKSRREKDHILSYHLDRHIQGGNDNGEVHPIYHFQMGGYKIDSYKGGGKNFGNQLILDNPRFMHYPMDFILGLDFAISNFNPLLWAKLKKDPFYLKVLRKSQERTLKPFVASLASHFDLHNIPNNWNTKQICPQII
ncbi:MAG: hypothetical protein KDC67_03010, partial [Ignavibacteriae bacterium]|nr:hypothetical protein [Ignavibacteriota bacterium]